MEYFCQQSETTVCINGKIPVRNINIIKVGKEPASVRNMKKMILESKCSNDKVIAHIKKNEKSWVNQ